VLQNVGNGDLIYIAAHGSYDDQNPNDRSFLVLSDGAFTARTIAKLKLPRRPIVVMSACQTGLGKTFESGVIGLAKAWKYAGASTVVMTLWSVYDEPTRDLMVEFMTLLQSGQDADLALQTAMRSLKANKRYSHPVYWAGFMIYGAPGRY
jgi:CHAT domain-containing protein